MNEFDKELNSILLAIWLEGTVDNSVDFEKELEAIKQAMKRAGYVKDIGQAVYSEVNIAYDSDGFPYPAMKRISKKE